MQVFQLAGDHNFVLFDVANDPVKYFYNSVLNENTYCASQFSWLNRQFRGRERNLI